MGICEKSTINIILNYERMDILLLRLEARLECPVTISLQHYIREFNQ